MAKSSALSLLGLPLVFIIAGLVMVLTAAKHIGGDIVEGTCQCTGERDVTRRGSSRFRECKVDVNGVFPGTNGTDSRNLTNKRLHDAPSDCTFCDVGNGTFPCYLNTASDYVGHHRSSHTRFKTTFVVGLVFLVLGVCCCLTVAVLVVMAGSSSAAYQPDYQLDHSLGGYGYTNPAPTPDFGYMYGAQQQPQDCFGPGAYGAQPGAYGAQYGQMQQMALGTPVAQGAPYYGGYYGNPSAF